MLVPRERALINPRRGKVHFILFILLSRVDDHFFVQQHTLSYATNQITMKGKLKKQHRNYRRIFNQIFMQILVLIRNGPRLRDLSLILTSELVHSLTISVTRTFTQFFKQKVKKEKDTRTYIRWSPYKVYTK